MKNENKNLREIFVDSIVKITKPNADIITLDSFADELNKRKIKLNYLYLLLFYLFQEHVNLHLCNIYN